MAGRDHNQLKVFGLAAPRASVGFTSPTTIYERMRRIDRRADALNQDVLTNVADQGTSGAFKRAWLAYYDQWKRFFTKTLNEKVGNLLHTDELSAEVDRKESELLGFERDYPAQRRADGTLVPSPSAPKPEPLPRGGSGPGGESILPWWAWMIGGIAVVGIGYLGYQKYREMQAKRRAIETEVLPGVLGGFFGPKTGSRLAKAASARDPSFSGRTAENVEPSRDPMKLAFYGDPRNMPAPSPRLPRELPMVYRPYEHPHLSYASYAPLDDDAFEETDDYEIDDDLNWEGT